jgi:hypothetical protein
MERRNTYDLNPGQYRRHVIGNYLLAPLTKEVPLAKRCRGLVPQSPQLGTFGPIWQASGNFRQHGGNWKTLWPHPSRDQPTPALPLT